MKTTLLSFLLTFSCYFSVAIAGDDQFPLRVKFPSIPTIEMKDLEDNYAKAIIVDVRSSHEFNVIHIEKAIHISMGDQAFLPSLAKSRAKDSEQLMVLYCNGVKCAKSFEAAEKAIADGFKNIKVLDSGVLKWVKTHPDKGFLMGKSPADSTKIIDEKDYKSKWIDFGAVEKAVAAGAIAIDIRDPVQKKKQLTLANLRSITFDKTIDLIKAGQFKDKTVIFIDAVGKQNEWLQYYLEENKYTDYKFLANGADSIP